MDRTLKKSYKFMGWIFLCSGLIPILSFILFSGIHDIRAIIAFSIGFIPFIAFGAFWLVHVRKKEKLEKEIKLKGIKRICKIYELVNNNSYIINGEPAINIRLRFIDNNDFIRERLCMINIASQKCKFSRGKTVDAYEYQGAFVIDEKSIRNEILSRENELMSEKPLDMSAVSERTTQRCKNCGALYPIVKDTKNQCPYCGTYNE